MKLGFNALYAISEQHQLLPTHRAAPGQRRCHIAVVTDGEVDRLVIDHRPGTMIAGEYPVARRAEDIAGVSPAVHQQNYLPTLVKRRRYPVGQRPADKLNSA